MFFSKIAYLYIVGTSPPCTIGAVIGSGNDELQCRSISAESAGGFRADPEDRKRHLRRCVQGKLQRGKRRSIIGQNVVLLHSTSLLNEQWEGYFHVTVQPFVILWSLIFNRLRIEVANRVPNYIMFGPQCYFDVLFLASHLSVDIVLR